MSDTNISMVNHFERHELKDGDGNTVVIYGLDVKFVGKMYAFLYDFMKIFLDTRGYGAGVLSYELAQRSFDLSLDNLWRSMNYHKYASSPSESKLISRVVYYWLKHKPIRIRGSELVKEERRAADMYYINETFVVCLVYAFVAAHRYNRIVVGSEKLFIERNMKRAKDSIYHLYKHSVTLNTMEEYIESLCGSLFDIVMETET